MLSSNNIKNILTSLFSKSKEETDAQYTHLKTNMNKGWISSGTIEDIRGSNTTNDNPVGSIIAHMGNNAPLHYLACDGTEYNIEDYTELCNFFLSEFGSINYFGGDGITTFCVPDLRGEFLRGTGTNSHFDSLNNIPQGSGADVGIHQNATRHANYRMSYDGYYMGWVPNSASKATHSGIDNASFNDGMTNDTVTRWMVPSRSLANSGSRLFITSRPTNTSVLYCIKYESTKLLTVSMYDGTHYSTDECIIGQWIDGKPIYRKTLELNNPDYFTTIDTDGSMNIDQLVNIKGFGRVDDEYPVPINAVWNKGTYYLSVIGCRDKTQLEFQAYGWTFGKTILSIEYTKTTDTPYSVDEDIAWVALDSEVDDIINKLGE